MNYDPNEEYSETLEFLNKGLVKEITEISIELEAGKKNNKLSDPIFRKNLHKQYEESFRTVEELKKILYTWNGHSIVTIDRNNKT